MDIGPFRGMFSDVENAALAIMFAFERKDWYDALRVAGMETGQTFDPHAHNTNGEDSRGIFQVNVVPEANPQYADLDLYDPYVCAQIARRIKDQWGNWGAWYNSAVALGLPH